MSFKLAGVDHAPLFASWEDTPDWPTDGRLVYAYHRPFPGVEWNDYIKLVIPFASFTKTEADAGLSFCTDLAFPVLPMRITARQADACTHVEIERPLVRLEPNAAVTLVHYIAPHDGDVRSGLRWLRETFRDKFTVPESAPDIQTELTGIPYVMTDHYRRKALSERPGRWGAANLRLMPWWGKHVADEEPFVNWLDHKWCHFRKHRADHPEIPGFPSDTAVFDEIVSFIEGLSASEETIRKIEKTMKDIPEMGSPLVWLFERFTFDDVRERLDWMRDMNFKILMYWDLSEAWRPWVEKRFPDILLFDEKNDSFWDLTVIDPYAGSEFQKEHLRQLERVFDTYPQMEGVFIDQTYYDDVTHDKRDDGLSIDSEGKPYTRYV